MRRGLALVAVCLVLVFVPSAAHGAGVPRVYEGTTDQDRRLSLGLTKRDDGSLRIHRLSFRRLVITCEIDASTQVWGITTWWSRGARLEGRRLSIDHSDSHTLFVVSGYVGALHASGDVEFAIASFTEDGQAQACTTGTLGWTADRTVPAPQPMAAGATAHDRVIEQRVGPMRITFVRLR